MRVGFGWGNVRKKVAPEPSVFDGHVTAQSHPDTYGTVMLLPKTIQTPMGQCVTHLGELWMAMGLRLGIGRTHAYGSEYCSTALWGKKTVTLSLFTSQFVKQNPKRRLLHN